jgi:hypothetical protein
MDLQGLAVNPGNGSVYISDYGANRIREVRIDTNIYALVGSGANSSNGDGGPYNDPSVTLMHPAGLSLTNWVSSDASRTVLLIAETYGQRIREVAFDEGNILTLAGDGTRPSYAGDGGNAIHGQLSFPSGVVVDSNLNVYVAGDGRVRRIDASDGTISTVAGPNQGLVNPFGLAIDGDDNLYAGDPTAHEVFKIEAGTWNTSVYAGNGIVGSDGDGGRLGVARHRPLRQRRRQSQHPAGQRRQPHLRVCGKRRHVEFRRRRRCDGRRHRATGRNGDRRRGQRVRLDR